jgi:predicted RNase H-like HicB family nuclease
MKNISYIAIFNQEPEGGYSISFPDFPECLTEGDDLDHGHQMAVDALDLVIGHYLDKKMELPSRTDLEKIEVEKNQLAIDIKITHLN